jgi:hypothetical protein
MEEPFKSANFLIKCCSVNFKRPEMVSAFTDGVETYKNFACHSLGSGDN